MSLIPNFHVLIVAAGGGTRSGEPIPKQYCAFGGKQVLRHCLDTFMSIPGLGTLQVIINPMHQGHYNGCAEGLSLPPPVFGGKTRKDSVNSGLGALPLQDEAEIVLIHDAARPFVQKPDILELVRAIFDGADAATLARPVADTVLYAAEREDAVWCSQAADRDKLWALQTPQAFRFGVIKKAHELCSSEQAATDDTSLVRSMGVEVKLVQGSPLNFKITYPGDLTIAEQIYSGLHTLETRTGSGFDVHAFADTDESASHIRLCGVDIPYNRKLDGHSDADVGLHALTDALLGAMGEADIGTHFPPSNAKFKGMDSAEFLVHAVRLLQDKGGRLINADVTLICEAPMIGPHREAIVKRIAEILGVSEQRINIKATTTEGLGFTGRREGIAAQAAVSIALPKTIDKI